MSFPLPFVNILIFCGISPFFNPLFVNFFFLLFAFLAICRLLSFLLTICHRDINSVFLFSGCLYFIVIKFGFFVFKLERRKK